MRTTALATVGIAAVAALALSGCAADNGGEDPGRSRSRTPTSSRTTATRRTCRRSSTRSRRRTPTSPSRSRPSYADYGTALQTDLAAGTVSRRLRHRVLELRPVPGERRARRAAGRGSRRLPPVRARGVRDRRHAVRAAELVLDGRAVLQPATSSTRPASSTRPPTGPGPTSRPRPRQLTDAAAGVWGDHQPVSFYEYYKVLAQNGGEFLDDVGHEGRPSTSPEGIEAAEWLVGKSGTVMPTIEQGQGTPDFDTNLFKDGKLAMLHTGIWMFGAFADVPFGWDIAVEPGNTQQASALFSNAVGVSRRARSTSRRRRSSPSSSPRATSWSTTRLDAGWELPPISDEDAKLATLPRARQPRRTARRSSTRSRTSRCPRWSPRASRRCRTS